VAVAWASSNNYKTDSNAYLFSLRVNGVSTSIKYTVVHTQNAIGCFSNWGPTFGNFHDLHISDASNLNNKSHTICHCYQCPNGTSQGNHHSKFAGSANFTVSEIEVFQIV
jgi:hypothetical protein